jgi:protein gp37
VSEHTGISWTDHTFNPWWGCTKVSEACARCYAERDAKRFRPEETLWGPGSTRQLSSEAVWNEPRRWNRKALAGVRRRVFCASMADVFEDHPALPPFRARLWELIESTPGLDWLLLTKRPRNVSGMVPGAWTDGPRAPGGFPWAGWPRQVWIGTTVESQEHAGERLEPLLQLPAPVRFVSAEPLLGALDLSAYLGPARINWVIAGGESGHGARAMAADWARSLRDQSQRAGVAFHFKQWGEWAPAGEVAREHWPIGVPLGLDTVVRWGKKAAGRTLDGRTWDEIPVGGLA